jgi:putative proteasome-type protease
MTYCVAIRVDGGLVFASDSRTHAGVDQISSYSKMHLFEPGGDRLFVMLSAGNLATTHAVARRVRRDMIRRRARPSLATVDDVLEAARYVGEISRAVQNHYLSLNPNGAASFEASFIVGGQTGGEAPDLYLVYPEGNAIPAPEAKPYLQIGENKYGKPILDRIIEARVSLEDAARCAILSLDSTMRSNLAVGPPFELLVYRTDTFRVWRRLSLDSDNPTLTDIQRTWSETLRQGIDVLPRFEWEAPSDSGLPN